MVHMICLAALFIIASAFAQANQCSSGGECPSNDMPQSVVSLLQTKIQNDGGVDLNVADDSALQPYSKGRVPGGWYPAVSKYMQELESLERSGLSLFEGRREEVDPSASVVGETLFVVMSDSGHYSNNLRWISESWGKDLSSAQLQAIGDEASDNSTRMLVKQTSCPTHTMYGACCKAAEAVITAHQMLEKQPNLKWAYIVEDDAYVRTEAVDRQLKRVDPVGATSRGTLIALTGCRGIGSVCRHGVCGAGGLALSREALRTLVGDMPSKYLRKHMQTCEDCGMSRGDETIGEQAHAHNITVLEQTPTTMGMHGQIGIMSKHAFDITLTSVVEPLMYHPLKKEGMFKFLHQLFFEQHKSVEDLHGDYCANYNGNTACTPELIDTPWLHWE